MTVAQPLNDRVFAQLSARTWHDIGRLRVDVFVVEQACAYPEFDGRDVEPGTRHVWVTEDARCIAYLRVLDDGAERRIGRVATAAEHRGSGYATRLIGHVLAETDGPWVLDAQTHLAGWYEAFDFTVQSAPFDDYGIPHVVMRRAAR